MSAPDLLDPPLGRVAFRFGLPLALGMAFHGLFNCVDLVIVGRLGAGAIAAVTLGGVVNMVAMLLFNGVVNQISARVSFLAGSGRRDEIPGVARATLALTVLVSIVLGGLQWALAGTLVELVPADGATHADGTLYLRILGGGSATMFLILWGTAVLRAVGSARWPVGVLVGANVLNLALDVLWVYGLAGFPALGVAGAAWATVVSRGLGAAVLIGGLLVGASGVSLRAAGPPAPRGTSRDLVARGLPSSLQMVVRVVAMYVLLAAAGRIAEGTADGAARDLVDGIGMCIRLEMVFVFFGLGWGASAGAVVGQSLGAGLVDRARRSGWVAFAWCAALVVAVSPVFLAFDRTIFSWIAPELPTRAYDEGALYLLVTVPAYAIAMTGVVLSQALNGAASTRTPLVIDTLSYLLVLGLAAFFTVAADGGVIGCWISLIAAHTLAAACYVVVWRRGRWAEGARVPVS